MKCRLCGAGVSQCDGYLERVNETGVPGVWECRPACFANLSPDAALLAALAVPETDNGK